MQAVRQIMHAPGDLPRTVQRRHCRRTPTNLSGVGHQLEIDFEQRHLLADVVVEFAGNPRPFFLMRVQEASPEVPDPPVADLQLRRVRPHLGFGPLTPDPLDHEAGNERRLNQENREDTEDIPTVAVPRRGLPEPDEHVARNALLGDCPSLQLPPVDLADVQVGRRDRNAVGGLPFEDAKREACKRPHLEAVALEAASDDAVVHGRVHPAIRGSVGHRGDAIEIRQRMDDPSSAVPVDDHVVDDRLGRQRRKTRLQGAGRQPSEIRDREPRLESLELESRERLVGLVAAASADDDEHVAGVWLQRQRQVDRAAEVHRTHHARGVRVPRAG